MKELFSKLTWADYIALMALLRGLYVGYKSGFFQELLRVAAYAVTLGLTLYSYGFVASYLTLHTFLNESIANALAFGGVFIGIYIAIKILRTIITKMLKVGEGGAIQRFIGALTGGARWLVLLSFFFLLVDKAPFSELKNDVHERSLTGPYISKAAPSIIEFVSNFTSSLEKRASKG